jgi:hypothetical protein
MSTNFKINGTILAAWVSIFATAAYVVWTTSAKANDIEVAKREIMQLQESDKAQSAILNRLDERTVMILDTLKSFVRGSTK